MIHFDGIHTSINLFIDTSDSMINKPKPPVPRLRGYGKRRQHNMQVAIPTGGERQQNRVTDR